MKALFAGSFDPFTIGHDSIVRRALRLFDEGVTIAIGYNCNKTSCSDIEERVDAIRRIYNGVAGVEVAAYSCLTTDFARQCGAGVLLRGVRSVKDFEYERDLADINRRISGIDTVILPAEPDMAMISSSMVRELMRYSKDVSEFLPR
ncbi:MAG: pantetheine-phosphate adenylyltransferase [Muribaculaceae bacterium]|nr:pantetheine-phosphate adenylyltransferase [Muribaculaceae bacterium]MDE5929942.1 pantetheine-phosphate adenylyltransferase [Muribaculaceae bacterium]